MQVPFRYLRGILSKTIQNLIHDCMMVYPTEPQYEDYRHDNVRKQRDYCTCTNASV